MFSVLLCSLKKCSGHRPLRTLESNLVLRNVFEFHLVADYYGKNSILILNLLINISRIQDNHSIFCAISRTQQSSSCPKGYRCWQTSQH